MFFPSCEFKLSTADGYVRAGSRNEGFLELVLPDAVPRAEHLDLVFRSLATAGYGQGKGRRVITRALAHLPLRVDLPGGLGAGSHRFPFALDLPAHLPPAVEGDDCSIRHLVDLRLDVDWAIDPVATMAMSLLTAPFAQPTARRPLALRSANGFHDRIAIELSLDSAIVVHGEAISGSVALRGGHDVELGEVRIALMQVTTIMMGRRDARQRIIATLHLPADRLRAGEVVPFQLPTSSLAPGNHNGFIDLSTRVEIVLDQAWWRPSAKFGVDVAVLPWGSAPPHPVNATPLLGSARMHYVAERAAAQTGLAIGRLPTVVYGREGPVDLSVVDASHGPQIFAIERHLFPDLHLGIRSRPHGVLQLGSSLAPARLGESYTIRAESKRVGEPELRAFMSQVLADADDAIGIELTDHHLAITHRLRSDDEAEWVAVASRAKARAKAIGAAIQALPFVLESARAAWTDAAAVESAFLVPHLPAIAFVNRAARTVSGEERRMACAIAVVPERAHTRVDLTFDAPLPASAVQALHEEPKDDVLRALRARFSSIDATSPEHLVAISEGVADDPRALLDALDSFLDWYLRARGERRVDAPYR